MRAGSDIDMGPAFSAPPSIEITMKGFCPPLSLCESTLSCSAAVMTVGDCRELFGEKSRLIKWIEGACFIDILGILGVRVCESCVHFIFHSA